MLDPGLRNMDQPALRLRFVFPAQLSGAPLGPPPRFLSGHQDGLGITPTALDGSLSFSRLGPGVSSVQQETKQLGFGV